MKNASKAEPSHRSSFLTHQRPPSPSSRATAMSSADRAGLPGRAPSNHRPEATLTDPVHPSPTSSTITPVLVADMRAEDERMPVYVHVIDHPDARVLVDTGITEPHPLVD